RPETCSSAPKICSSMPRPYGPRRRGRPLPLRQRARPLRRRATGARALARLQPHLQRALRRLHREKVQRGQGEDRERRDPSSLKVDLGQSPQLLWTKTPAGLVVGPSSSDCLLLLWHSASLRCVAELRARSEPSAHSESADRCPALLTMHFARRRDIGAIRTIAKKRSLAVACRT